jgi:hypothetical protein
MSAISAVGAGASLPHLNLLKEDNLKDDKTRELLAAKQGDGPSALADSTAATEVDAAGATPNDQLPSQDDLLTKINTLITNEQSSGKLSDDRAAALRNVFSNALTGSTEGQTTAGTSASEPVAGANGSTSPTSAAPIDASSPGQSVPAGTSAAGDVSHDVGSVLNDFLKLLQDAKSTASTYSASGSTNVNPPSSGARLVNYRA